MPSTRSRPAKEPLSLDAILDSALEILRTEGLDALSMRSLAASLDTGAASLYVYVANREELHSLVFDRILTEVQLPKADKRKWRKQLIEICYEMTRVLGRYPGSARLGIANIPTGDGAMQITEAILELLTMGGVEGQAAAWAIDLLSMFVMSIAHEQSIWATKGMGSVITDAGIAHGDEITEYVEGIQEQFSNLDPQRYPFITTLGPLLTEGDGDMRFRFALNVIISGLLSTPQR